MLHGERRKREKIDTEIERQREFSVPLPDLEHCCKQKEKSIGINTVRLYICHHQIVGTVSGMFFFFLFLDLGMKYYFLLSVFCWKCLDLILVLISLSLSLFSNICVHSFFFFGGGGGVLFGKHLLICLAALKHLLIAFNIKEKKPLKSVNCNKKEREQSSSES